MASLLFVVEFFASASPVLYAEPSPVGTATAPAGAKHVQARVFTPSNVQVNRTVPPTNSVPPPQTFHSPVTDDQLTQALVFEEKLVPVGGKTSATENAALGKAVLVYLKNRDDLSAFGNFLKAYPDSAWKATLLTNLGIFYRKKGYYSRALDAWRQAWNLGKKETSPLVVAAANRAIAELVTLLSSVGRSEEIQPLLDEVKDRPMLGTPATQLMHSRGALSVMLKKPGIAFKCGPYALSNVQRVLHPDQPVAPLILKVNSPKEGFSAAQLVDLSAQLDMQMQVAKRSPGAVFIIPSVIHWKVGHYAAILKAQEGKYLVKDPTFDSEVWLTPDALESEASGYFLVPSGDLPAGWTPVEKKESDGVWGRGYSQTSNKGGSKKNDRTTTCPPTDGMTVASVLLMLACLHLEDTPVSYTPAYGPSLDYTLRYNQYEASQSGTYVTSNLGPNWVPPWLSWVSQTGTSAGTTVTCAPLGGGYETYPYSSYVAYVPSGTGGHYGALAQGQVVLKMVPTANPARSSDPNQWCYERVHPDGSMEIFDSPSDAQNHVYITKIVDPQGKALTLTYTAVTAGYQLSSVSDALGQVTTFSYGLTSAGDSLKITSVTDPFGRVVTLGYTPTSPFQLTSITDVVGITSQFAYASGTSAITKMTTPYGTSTFAATQGTYGSAELVITDPNGAQERVLSPNPGDTGYDVYNTAAEPLPNVPYATTALEGGNMLDGMNTFYWDKKAMMDAPGDLTKAHVYHWLVDGVAGTRTGILYSEKKALESRVWYGYDHTGLSLTLPYFVGTSDQPTGIARVLDDGSTQSSSFQYNAAGNVTNSTDPLGRQMNYTYDTTTGMDLTVVKGMGSDVLGKIAYVSTPPHLPSSVIDASGQTTTYVYTTNAQVQYVTNTNGDKITYSYDPTSFLLTGTTITPSGTTTALTLSSFTYDGYNRIRTVTDSTGYVVTYDYDALNRPTVVTHPDGTYEQFVYDRLDLGQSKDRLNRWTTYAYDANRNRVSMEDPLGRITRFVYCTCGQLVAMVNPAGVAVTWIRDVQKRETMRINADGTTRQRSYDLASRLKTTTDEKGQVRVYTYNLDNDLGQMSWANPAAPIAPVSYTYDANYNRVLTMTDGTGTTHYTYNAYSSTPTTTTGAGRLATEASPTANSTIAYTYDALGRLFTRSIGTSGNTTTWSYDSLNRVTSVTNPLTPTGTFTYAYVNQTGRPSSVTYPNGQSTAFTYFTGSADPRLQTLENFKTGTTMLSRFDYTYDTVGNILSWERQANTTGVTTFGYQYDNADQLLGATLQDTASPPDVTENVYTYDFAANRRSEQISTGSGGSMTHTLTSSTYNARNQVQARAGGGALRFSGTLSQPANVTVGGSPATVSGTTFTGEAQVTTGSNNVPVTATTTSGQSVTHTYQVTVGGGTAASFTYDNNGNTLSDGTKSYEWDARNQLTAINYTGSLRTEFTYDGLGRRVAIVEKTSGTVTSTKNFVWVGLSLAEERDASNTVTKRFYGQGEQIAGTAYYFTRDHLGSVREMSDASGAVQARYDYDPYGRVTKVSGTMDADFGYTGHYYHAPSGLDLAPYRAYNPDVGRWLSEDPIGERGGMNLYGYVGNGPVNEWDPLGLTDINVNGDKWQTPIIGDAGHVHSLNGVDQGPHMHGPNGQKFFPNTGNLLDKNGNWSRASNKFLKRMNKALNCQAGSGLGLGGLVALGGMIANEVNGQNQQNANEIGAIINNFANIHDLTDKDAAAAQVAEDLYNLFGQEVSALAIYNELINNE